MEAAQATAVEGAILWLAQTIFETLEPGDLDAWLHRAGLAAAIGELKSEVERMETVVNGVKGRAVGNKPLARCLVRVKELMYDADDVVDELDYCRLQQQVEGVMAAPATEPEGMVGDGAEHVDASANTVVMLAPHIEPEGMIGDGDNRDGAEHADASASTADISDNNGRKNRCKERDYFHITPAVNGEPARAKCIDCGTQVVFSYGTSVLRKHRNSASCKNKRAAIEEEPNYPSTQNGAIISTDASEGRKRMTTENNVATITLAWVNVKYSKRIHRIALEFGCIGAILESLQPGELNAWLDRVGIACATKELKSEAERMEMLVNGVNGRAVGNKPLARSLARSSFPYPTLSFPPPARLPLAHSSFPLLCGPGLYMK